MKKSSINTFLKLIQISLGGEFHDFPSLDTAEWQELFILAHKQAIVGILSNIVETLPADKRPPREILLKWIVTAERIKHLNQHLNNTVPKGMANTNTKLEIYSICALRSTVDAVF